MKNYFTSPGKIFTFQIQKGLLSKIFRTSGMIMILLSFFIYGCKKVVEETGKVGICPTVVSTDPAAGAINVVTNKKISIVFSEPMDPATINTATVQLKQGSNFVLGTVTYSGVTAVFTPSAPLIANTVYTGTVTTGVKDPAKNAMIADFVWTFNTGNTPVVVSTDPANGASEVILTKAISATFSTPMDATTMVAANYFIKQGNTLVPGAVTYSGSSIVFTPTSSLTPNTVYTGTVTTGAKDVAGNAVATNYTWSFSTGGIPAVVSTDPANGDLNVSLNKVISATFNKKMNNATLNLLTYTLKQGSTNIPGTYSFNGTTASLTPIGMLAVNTVYTVTITTGAKDSAGNSIAADYIWSFTTGSAPVVVATDPANGDLSVPLTKTITASFSTAMNPATLNKNTFQVKKGATVLDGVYSYSGTTISFKPTLPLEVNTVYTAVILAGVKDLSGNSMAADYNWSFATNSIPAVTSTDPAQGATNVVLNKIIKANFNKPMDPNTINTSTFLLKDGATVILGTVSYTALTASFAPNVALTANRLYTATITTGAKDPSGNPLAADYTWTFTTSALPTVTSTDPANNATGVLITKILSANFSRAMDPTTINALTFQLKQGANMIAGNVTYSGTTATFTPAANLVANTVYTATITTGAKDPSGNAIAADYTWTFTTVGPPTVTSTDPLPNATGVIISKTITANFSRAMDPNTINVLTFQLKQGVNPIAGVITYTGTTASFNPNANLAANTLYTATITTGAKDPTGNALAADYTWSFTTVASVPPPPADILKTAAFFGAFGGNAGITNEGINTVINNGGIGTTAAATLITGFHDGLTGDVYTETGSNKGLVTGGIFSAPPFPGTATKFNTATVALADANAAYIAISPANKPGGSDPGAGELGGLTLAPGIYKSAGGTFKITNGDLVLDANGDPNAQWFFQAPTSLTVGIAGPAGARSVKLINGALAKNVYWYVGSAATINGAGGGVMTGNIIATAGVTFSTSGVAVQTVLNGRAISLVASVTMVNTTINIPN